MLRLLVEIAAVLDRVDPGEQRRCAGRGRRGRGTSRGGRAHGTRSTSACISSSENAASIGPWPGRELAPPVVAVLMTSAPARTIVRTTSRTASGPLATLAGRRGSKHGAAAMARRAHAVADAARRRDDLDREHEPRARDQALLDGDLEARVEPARVAHGGVAHGEGLGQHARGAQVRGARRLVEPPARRQPVAVRGQVVVRVDEARGARCARRRRSPGRRRARRGARRGPAAAIRSPSMTTAASAIGAAPVPSISVAPVRTRTIA